MVCWWVPAGCRPSTDEAEERVLYLRDQGPSPFALTSKQNYPWPGSARHGSVPAASAGFAPLEGPPSASGRVGALSLPQMILANRLLSYP